MAQATRKTGIYRLLYRGHRQDPVPAWMVFPIIYAGVFLSHWPLLRLPYFWDEAGYYIPAAYDFFRTGTLIPFSTLTNAHPPLSAIYLAAWWKISGFAPAVTRLAVCLIAALALTGVFALCRKLVNAEVAVATTLLTALYPVWFAQSTMAHADIFAAAGALWGLFYCLNELPRLRDGWLAALCFSLAALAKETAIATPLVLMLWHLWEIRRKPPQARGHLRAAMQLAFPVLPLAAWYAYHFHKTGDFFGSPEFVRYNAVATLNPLRFVIAFAERLMHVTVYMNLFVPVLCMIAAMFLPALRQRDGSMRPRITWNIQAQMGLVLLGNLLLFSVLGGALLTRYLLPLYPLVLLFCVSTWRRRVQQWGWLVLLSIVAFLAGLFVNPPYRFAPEDNLSYRNMILLQQQAIAQLLHRNPHADVLTAWPASDELTKPELGYVRHPVPVVEIQDFSLPQILQAAQLRGYNAALVFSTKHDASSLPLGLRWGDSSWNRRFFGYHHDLPPEMVARLLHGTVVWQQKRQGLWAAVILFNTAQDAQLTRPERALLPVAQNPDAHP
ncbi:MAG TPA: glycosyltransferase family 39 protein [Acidobacteriaceae bacterium]|jgi:4-amino-4-deoxy-L-arabinose transferase-like glycosyltransferase|nr:glycosyltransferase family 39 protein [Acidobacteriaceae bacterium]